jgi:ABC-type uncharacterized transport system permease subunit
MNNSEDIHDIKMRVGILEIAHIDNTSKIATLIESFNSLNLNLSKLITSINIAVKMAIGCGLFVITLTGALWSYHTYTTDQLIRQFNSEQRK